MYFHCLGFECIEDFTELNERDIRESIIENNECKSIFMANNDLQLKFINAIQSIQSMNFGISGYDFIIYLQN